MTIKLDTEIFDKFDMKSIEGEEDLVVTLSNINFKLNIKLNKNDVKDISQMPSGEYIVLVLKKQ